MALPESGGCSSPPPPAPLVRTPMRHAADGTRAELPYSYSSAAAAIVIIISISILIITAEFVVFLQANKSSRRL